MLTARKVVLTVIAIAVLSLLTSVASIIFRRYPDTKADSYGVYAPGYQALFEILDELGYAVERGISPPDRSLNQKGVLLFLGSSPDIVENEPVYLHRVGEWVKAGGKVIVTPDVDHGPFRSENREVTQGDFAITELGVTSVSFASYDPPEDLAPPREEKDDLSSSIQRSLWGETARFWTCSVIGEGDMQIDAADNASAERFQLQLPQVDLNTFSKVPDNATGTVRIADSEEGSGILAARIPMGKGTIILVSDARIFSNRNVAAASNAVLAVRLIGDVSKPVVFDEFYHGLTLRGNPMVLFGRLSFGLLALSVLLMTGLWAWRYAIFLGPPLSAQEKSRRDVMEYVDAMARFLKRSRGSNRFALEEVREAALRTTASKLGLTSGPAEIHRIQTVLSRRAPDLAKELELASDEISQLLSQPSEPDDKVTLQAMQRISNCY